MLWHQGASEPGQPKIPVISQVVEGSEYERFEWAGLHLDWFDDWLGSSRDATCEYKCETKLLGKWINILLETFGRKEFNVNIDNFSLRYKVKLMEDVSLFDVPPNSEQQIIAFCMDGDLHFTQHDILMLKLIGIDSFLDRFSVRYTNPLYFKCLINTNTIYLRMSCDPKDFEVAKANLDTGGILNVRTYMYVNKNDI
jgi:hypothetical protein